MLLRYSRQPTEQVGGGGERREGLPRDGARVGEAGDTV